jgi:hypothetical protein
MMFTAVDRVLLVHEFMNGLCTACGGIEVELYKKHTTAGVVEPGHPGHKLGCEWNEALSERGFTTNEERTNARRALTASEPTLPPPPFEPSTKP